jgi:uncharacterized protein
MKKEVITDYITYRIKKAEESFTAASLMAEHHLLTSAVNRCYYACFYMVDALFTSNHIMAKTHSGARNQFNLHFIKTGMVSVEFGELFSELADLRQEGDYGSKFEIEEKDLESLMTGTRKFIDCIKRLIPGDSSSLSD